MKFGKSARSRRWKRIIENWAHNILLLVKPLNSDISIFLVLLANFLVPFVNCVRFYATMDSE